MHGRDDCGVLALRRDGMKAYHYSRTGYSVLIYGGLFRFVAGSYYRLPAATVSAACTLLPLYCSLVPTGGWA